MSENWSGSGTKLDSAALSKRLNTQTWILNDLFMSGKRVGLSPDERVKDAGQELERAAKLLALRKQHPELEKLFARLALACQDAEERMERFIKIRIEKPSR